MDEEKGTDEALWKVSIIGPLISARLEHGDRSMLLREAAGKVYEGTDGRTIEVAVQDVVGLEALKPKGRTDAGCSRSIGPEIAKLC